MQATLTTHNNIDIVTSQVNNSRFKPISNILLVLTTRPQKAEKTGLARATAFSRHSIFTSQVTRLLERPIFQLFQCQLSI